jgi:hypothetical protein
MAKELGIFTRFKLADLNITSDKILDSRGSIGLMEKLLKYSRHRDAFNQLSQLLEKNKKWIILRGGYWKVLLIYSVQVIGKRLGKRSVSEKELITLFKDKLSVNEIARNLLLQLHLDMETVQKATTLSKKTKLHDKK